jgi:hypothetical protein
MRDFLEMARDGAALTLLLAGIFAGDLILRALAS